MSFLIDHPLWLFSASLLTLCLSAWFGARVLRRGKTLAEDVISDLGVVQGATMTLLALIIGFTFSMAVSRYDLRKTYEEAEANAIGTEFVRADLLPAAELAQVRSLLKRYLALRIVDYTERDAGRLAANDAATHKMQTELWSAIPGPALAQPTPVAALVVAGMNDVLNAQGYTQAAWWNRIPIGAWSMMGIIAVLSNVLAGYSMRSTRLRHVVLLIMPLVVSTAFLLIADIDSPRNGIIRVVPQNLASLAATLQAPWPQP